VRKIEKETETARLRIGDGEGDRGGRERNEE
jgi:hypothetical protein